MSVKGAHGHSAHLGDSCWAFHLNLALYSSRCEAFLKSLNEMMAPCQRLKAPVRFPFRAPLTCNGSLMCVSHTERPLHEETYRSWQPRPVLLVRCPTKGLSHGRHPLNMCGRKAHTLFHWDLTAHRSSSQKPISVTAMWITNVEMDLPFLLPPLRHEQEPLLPDHFPSGASCSQVSSRKTPVLLIQPFQGLTVPGKGLSNFVLWDVPCLSSLACDQVFLTP